MFCAVFCAQYCFTGKVFRYFFFIKNVYTSSVLVLRAPNSEFESAVMTSGKFDKLLCSLYHFTVGVFKQFIIISIHCYEIQLEAVSEFFMVLMSYHLDRALFHNVHLSFHIPASFLKHE